MAEFFLYQTGLGRKKVQPLKSVRQRAQSQGDEQGSPRPADVCLDDSVVRG